MYVVGSDLQRGQRFPEQETDQKDATIKLLYKFNRLLKLPSNVYYRVSAMGKEEPKTTREEYQYLGLTGHGLLLCYHFFPWFSQGK